MSEQDRSYAKSSGGRLEDDLINGHGPGVILQTRSDFAKNRSRLRKNADAELSMKPLKISGSMKQAGHGTPQTWRLIRVYLAEHRRSDGHLT
jgi:hypothetical protein